MVLDWLQVAICALAIAYALPQRHSGLPCPRPESGHMLHPDTNTASERARLWHGADLPRQVEHVQLHGVAQQQATFKVRKIRRLEAQPATGGREAGGCQRAGQRATDPQACRDAGAIQREIGAIDQNEFRAPRSVPEPTQPAKLSSLR